MRRLARHLFTAWCVLSLVLLVAVCVLWVRSGYTVDTARYASAVDPVTSLQWRVGFYSVEGQVHVCRLFRERTIGPPEDVLGGGLDSYPFPESPRPFTGFAAGERRPLGFGLVRKVTVDPATGPWEQRWTHTAVSVPHWFLALVLLVSPIRWTLIRFVAWRRRRAGRCEACGYDLRASGERCPECGATAGVRTSVLPA
jgi:hypothetical protein